MQTVNGVNDLQFIKNPDLWPRWPVLPMKRIHQGERECGILLACNGHLYTIFFTNIFDTRGRTGYLGEDFIDNVNVKRIVYDSYEQILQDGWEVD